MRGVTYPCYAANETSVISSHEQLPTLSTPWHAGNPRGGSLHKSSKPLSGSSLIPVLVDDIYPAVVCVDRSIMGIGHSK